MTLQKSFFERSTITVAKELLENILVRKVGNTVLAGIITETEAYDGPFDKASHASRGKTERTAPMFGEAGRVYIYLIYGMYHCLNIVTGKIGYPAAVLIRAVEPIEGIPLMVKFRKCSDLNNLANGPSKVCTAFAIDKKFNEHDICKSNILWIEKGSSPANIKTAKRIGVDYAEEYKHKLWRFFT